MSETRPTSGLFAIAFAILFNLPYAGLAQMYDYPHVLRRPAAEALDLFAAGGDALILTWYAFGFAALALIPLAIVLTITPARLSAMPSLTLGAALAGTLAGLTQAVGLMRWTFVVPDLASRHAADPAATESTFQLINAYGGVAIGEHMGQWLMALFVLCLGLMQWREGRKLTAGLAGLTVAGLVMGTFEGLAMATGNSGTLFAIMTTIAFLGLTVWLIATGAGLLRGQKAAAAIS